MMPHREDDGPMSAPRSTDAIPLATEPVPYVECEACHLRTPLYYAEVHARIHTETYARPVVSEPFHFGPSMPPGAVGGCCGKPVGCRISSRGCLHKVEKHEWQERVATSTPPTPSPAVTPEPRPWPVLRDVPRERATWPLDDPQPAVTPEPPEPVTVEPDQNWIPCDHGVTHGGHDFAEDTEWGVNHHWCPGGRAVPVETTEADG